MKSIIALKSIFVLGVLLFASRASALELLILGGPTISNPAFTQSSFGQVTVTDSATASGVGFTMGVLTRIPLSADFQLETGLAYLQRNYTVSVTGSLNYSFDETLKGIHIPVLVRTHVIENLSVGLGGYFAHELGDVYDTNLVVDGQSFPNQANSYTQNQYNRNDFGLEGSIAYDLPILPQYGDLYALTVDIRYLFGLTDFGAGSSTATSLNTRDVLFTAGLKLAL
jgi:hypothetical protein